MAKPILMDDQVYDAGRPRYNNTVTNATSEPVILDTVDRDTSVIVDPQGGASGKVQKTLSSHEEIENDNAAWYDWDAGDVSSKTETVFAPAIVAPRLIASGGDVDWFICQ